MARITKQSQDSSAGGGGQMFISIVSIVPKYVVSSSTAFSNIAADISDSAADR